MLIGYARISKSDGRQTLDLQIDALKQAGITEKYIYKDEASGSIDDRQDLNNCLKTLISHSAPLLSFIMDLGLYANFGFILLVYLSVDYGIVWRLLSSNRVF